MIFKFIPMTKTAIPSLRRHAFERQQGRCCYCGLPMWEADPERFAARYAISARLAALLRCTAEHVVAQRDGGRHHPRNIVAACAFCNSRRHKGRAESAPSAENYRRHVQRRIATGRWHPAVALLLSPVDGGSLNE